MAKELSDRGVAEITANGDIHFRRVSSRNEEIEEKWATIRIGSKLLVEGFDRAIIDIPAIQLSYIIYNIGLDNWRSIGSKKIGYDHTRPDRSDLIHFNDLPHWEWLGSTFIIEKHDDNTTLWFTDPFIPNKIFLVYTVPNEELAREISNYNAMVRRQEAAVADIGRSAAVVNNAIRMPVEQPVNPVGPLAQVDPRPRTCFGRFCNIFRRTARVPRGGRRRSQRKRKTKKTRHHKKRF